MFDLGLSNFSHLALNDLNDYFPTFYSHLTMECRRICENCLQEDEEFGKHGSGASQFKKEMGTSEYKEKYRKKRFVRSTKNYSKFTPELDKLAI